MIIWKTIPDYPSYQISNTGLVKSFKIDKINGRILKPKNHKGYKSVDLSNENHEINSFQIHRLVLSTFSPIDGWQELTVNHKDGDPSNNNLENLEWMTRTENVLHAVDILKHGNFRSYIKIITFQDEILFFKGTREAARQLNVSAGAISRWALGDRRCTLYKSVDYISEEEYLQGVS